MCLLIGESVDGSAHLRELMKDIGDQNIFFAVCLGNQETHDLASLECFNC